MNYYEILQVSSAASHEVIQMAYQTLQNQYHIESLQGDKKYAELKMQQLDEAYRVLSSPILRQQYDNMLRMGDAQNSLDPQVPQQTKQTVPSRKRVFPALLAILLVVVAAAGLLLYKHLNNKPDKISSAVSVVSLDEYKEIVTNYGLPVYIYPEEMQKFGNAEVYATNFGGPYSKWPDQECMMVYYAIHPDHDMALHEENMQLSVQEDDVAKWGILDSAVWSTQNGDNYAYTEVDDTEEGCRYLVNCVVDNLTVRIAASRAYKDDAQNLFKLLVTGLGNDQAEAAPEEQYSNTFVNNWLKNPETGEEIPKNQVQSVTFLGTLTEAPENSWDVSSSQDRSVLAWAIPNGKVYDIYMAAEGGVNAAGSCNDLFNGFRKLERVSFNDAFHTENVKDMSYMFGQCILLQKIDMAGLDTSNVTNMSGMFYMCEHIAELDLSCLDTANVTDMSKMFYDCRRLGKLNMSCWDTSNVTNMAYMFADCNNMEEFDLTGFDTGNVLSMRGMFAACLLPSLDLSGFDTSKVTDMSGMFQTCMVLKSLDLSGFNTSNVSDMNMMFSECHALRELDVSNFDTSKVRNMSSMFSACQKITILDLKNFDTSNVADMSFMFSRCSALTQLDLSNFDTSSVLNMNFMFSNCTNLTSLNIENFNTSNVTDMSGMFSQVFNLKKLKLGEFDTSKVVFEQFEEGFASTDYLAGIYWRDLFKN